MENKQFCKRVISVAEFKRFLLCFEKEERTLRVIVDPAPNFFKKKRVQENPRFQKKNLTVLVSTFLKKKESKRIEGFEQRIEQFKSPFF